jgi:hypothetical protein
MAALDLPRTPGTEIVLHADPEFPIAIGNCAVLTDPFGNSLTLVDMTSGPRPANLADS